MSPFLIIVGGFIAAVSLSEVALKGTKLQTGLSKVILVHAAVLVALLIYVIFARPILWPALIIFWAGAFLTWFGVRSHFESSILLRMLYLLRRGTIPETSLLQQYGSHYGEAQRLDELFRGGLLQESDTGAVVTSKGKFILRIVSLLT